MRRGGSRTALTHATKRSGLRPISKICYNQNFLNLGDFKDLGVFTDKTSQVLATKASEIFCEEHLGVSQR